MVNNRVSCGVLTDKVGPLSHMRLDVFQVGSRYRWDHEYKYFIICKVQCKSKVKKKKGKRRHEREE
jgi:hypothetical protein